MTSSRFMPRPLKLSGLASIALLGLTLVGCQTPSTTQSSQPAADASALTASSTAGNELAAAAPQAAKSATEAAADMNSCPGKNDGCSGGEAAKADQTRFGSKFQLAKSETLSTAGKRASDEGQVVQVSGTVDAVCKKRGCWMVLRDGDASARVFTHAGDFLLPVSIAKGRKALVEGKLKSRTLTESFAKHLAEDGGEDPSAVKGKQRELVIQATSVKLL